ncbi:Lrp/AsnC family transcriptional regulator [Methanothrix harundinacea]|uniref:Putative transcriptional regulator, AsnC family n=1 Tax=Methanothrix harundinacea (strain 6Ac) TaxID=1110509 RepID=G7WNC7_METH6|nr:Lrp/AsnC family transcriptional regulator [Methanothrix harundinacea]AET64618.1 Putative transcriptional regulator, AsnC family [Methanothrix harundinacea 6Ac]
MPLKLTSKEKLVLYGLARYPGLSDIDLAGKIGVDRSTIFKSKRKFREWEMVQLLNVPSGMGVGAEMMTAVFTRYRPNAPVEVRGKKLGFGEWVDHPHCVFHSATDSDSVSMVYSRSYTDFKRVFNPVMDDYKDAGFVDDIRCYHYPFSLTRVSWDSALAVNNTFNLGRTDLLDEPPIEEEAPEEEVKLTEKDRLALLAFVKYPALSDLELSRRTGISRPTISGKRNKFFQSGLLARQANVNWKKIGCELMIFYHINVRPKATAEEMMRIYSSFRRIGAAVYSYIQPGEIFGSFLSQCYVEMKERMDLEVKALSEVGLVEERPSYVIMPLRDLKVRKTDYAPMVKSMLEVETDV